MKLENRGEIDQYSVAFQHDWKMFYGSLHLERWQEARRYGRRILRRLRERNYLRGMRAERGELCGAGYTRYGALADLTRKERRD